MKRRLLNLLTLLSLLLAAAAAVVWVLSYQPVNVSVGYFGNFPFGVRRDGAENFRIRVGGYGFAAWARRGHAHFYWQELRSKDKRPAVGSMWAEVKPSDPSLFGFALKRAPRGPANPGRSTRWARQGVLRVPLWSLVVLPLGPPAWSLRRRYVRRREQRRRARGLCPACGYDIRATPGQCPECGAAATTPT